MSFDGPFLTFNFRVSLRLPGDRDDLCQAEFSECDGLEISIEPKTFREGGNNVQQLHLVGPVAYGQLTLKRGMSKDAGLWDWLEKVVEDGNRGLRASGRVEVLSSDRSLAGDENLPAATAAFVLTGCLPIKIKAPGLNAKDGSIAIEEMQLVYETLRRDRVQPPAERSGRGA